MCGKSTSTPLLQTLITSMTFVRRSLPGICFGIHSLNGKGSRMSMKRLSLLKSMTKKSQRRQTTMRKLQTVSTSRFLQIQSKLHSRKWLRHSKEQCLLSQLLEHQSLQSHIGTTSITLLMAQSMSKKRDSLSRVSSIWTLSNTKKRYRQSLIVLKVKLSSRTCLQRFKLNGGCRYSSQSLISQRKECVSSLGLMTFTSSSMTIWRM